MYPSCIMSRVKIIVIHSDSFPDLFSFYTQIADPRLLSEEILRIYGDLTSQHPGGDRMRSFPWGRMVSIRSLAFQASCFSGGGLLSVQRAHCGMALIAFYCTMSFFSGISVPLFPRGHRGHPWTTQSRYYGSPMVSTHWTIRTFCPTGVSS